MSFLLLLFLQQRIRFTPSGILLTEDRRLSVSFSSFYRFHHTNPFLAIMIYGWLRDYLVSGLCPSVWIDCNNGMRTVKDFVRYGISEKEKIMMGEWLSRAPYVRIEDKYIIMHGGIPSGWTMLELEKIAALPPSTIGYPGIEYEAVSPIWNRTYLQSAMAFENGADPAVLQNPLETEKKIFIGHTPLNSPFHSERYHLTAIDTGAGHGKKLTLMDMDTLVFWQAEKEN